ncbi:MAG TPA: 30S ribosomal protein S11 [Candidatus Nanoarchaeia archaeon]|nr:30S ribosomal protein S11 [Candidatus Nanoarchaeia archaeon]
MTEKDKNKGEAREVKLEEKLVVEEIKELSDKKSSMPADIEIKEDSAEFEEQSKAEKKREKEERAAIAYIFSSANNTIVHITDLAGNTLSRVTGGMITKHSRLKSNPTTAMFVAKKAAERARDLGITSLYIRSRAKTNSPGLGPGGHAAIKTLSKEGFRIISLLDTTKVPRGGPKKKGGKRGRRV